MPTNESLKGMRVAVLATDGYEQSELTEPVKALRNAGAAVDIVSDKDGAIRGWNKSDWGDSVDVDRTIEKANADSYRGLVLPGGVMNPDKLRMNAKAVNFVRDFFKAGKPVAAICHGPQILIECDVLTGREVTSYPAIKTDLKNAGARWVDKEVVVDQGLTTSRTPKDLPAFCGKMIEELAEGAHAGQKTA
ncbi:MAG: type 1 glutamine amidotransferase domain-containing protein [Planctomycetota bacterium]|nr:type 1 glutamine amidotransferase domain-containing protein [Planctomycetota bacterium]